MCGRYATTRGAADLSALFEALDTTAAALAADYNVAPTDPVPVVRVSRGQGGRVLSRARWGLLPPWASDARAGARMINARAETVATAKAFASSFARRRCLVPADGWYEWLRRDGGRQAYFLTPRDGAVLAFAGLWAMWTPPGADPAGQILTCTIVTTAAVGDLALVHRRMPLVLPAERWAGWLTGPADAGLLTPPTGESVADLEIRPVGPAVGDVRNDGPSLVAPVPAAPLAVPASESINLTLF